MYAHRVPTRGSNYKRIHHWHERISQLLLAESRIPAEDMLQIGEKLCDGSHTTIDKDTIRAVLRSLNMQQYIEKWLQIINRITGIAPPVPGSGLLAQLDTLFIELQRPFNAHKSPIRKNFLNYNYVFCRLFQMQKCSQFSMFFPLIKSKAKLKALDDTWCEMVRAVNWEVTPLQLVPPFAVQLAQPAALLQRLGWICAQPAPAAPLVEPWRMVYRMWGRPDPEKSRQSPKLLRSDQPAQEFRRLGSRRRRLR